jgi:putative ABC transport system substrate-binding protein
MKRRDFITLLGGVAAWPFAALAQQSERVRRIGFLNGAADDADQRAMYEAFRQGLQRLGWIDGRNVQIDMRFGATDPVRTRKYAAELVALSPDVILVAGGFTTQLLLQETRTVLSSSPSSPTRSAPASSKACRNRAETRRASCSSNTA